MEVGKEFTSWESFQNALDQFSEEKKVAYVMGHCKSIETVSMIGSDFPSKLKYSFARLWCKNYSNLTKHSIQHTSPQSSCRAGCSSTIFVSVNKSRTALVIREAHLKHLHSAPQDVDIKKPYQHEQLLGEEFCMATVLLRTGVQLTQVHEFISKFGDKINFIRHLEKFKSVLKVFSLGKKKSVLEYLKALDDLMTADPRAIVEMINFDLLPGGIYIQTSRMLDRMKFFHGGQLQIITHLFTGLSTLVSIVGVDQAMNPHMFTCCIILDEEPSTFQHFLETFVKYNSDFCDSIQGIVTDCTVEKITILQVLIPQANVAWSQSYITGQFSNLLDGRRDKQECLALLLELIKSEDKKSFDDAMDQLFNSVADSELKDFLIMWDMCKEWWAWYEIASHKGLQHQKCAVELGYNQRLKAFINPEMSLSDLIKALLKLDECHEPDDTMTFLLPMIHPCFRQYKLLCIPEAAQGIICQIAIALSSAYCINVKKNMTFIKRSDCEDEYILDSTGSKCTCQYHIDTDLPCQHLFAWLNKANKPLYNETLVPIRYQVFGQSITHNALVESLSSGHLPSSSHLDQRLKQVQEILRDILRLFCSHPYQQMGKDLVLLQKLLLTMRNYSSLKCKQLTLLNSDPHKDAEQEIVSCSTAPRRRGRPSKKDKHHQQPLIQPVCNEADKLTTYPVTKHNLRTNIKHKFVTRESYSHETPHKKPKENAEDLKHSFVQNDLHSKTDAFGMKETLHKSNVDKVSNVKEANVQLKITNHITKFSGDSQNTVVQQQCKFDSDLTHSPAENYEVTSRSDSDDDDETLNEDDINNENEETNDNIEGEDFSEKWAQKAKYCQKVKDFLKTIAQDSLNELLTTVSTLLSSDVKSECEAETTGRESPVNALIEMCEDSTLTEFIINCLQKLPLTYSHLAYKVSAAVIERSAYTGVPLLELSQAVSHWPAHLPEFPASRLIEEELTLSDGQILRLGSYKVNQEDMNTLKMGQEISHKVLHAYLEILAQKHSGKIFIIPYDVILSWRSGNYSDKLFKKVYLKTYNYIILPINCGAEFTVAERLSRGIPEPCWMALLADIKEKTVSIMNPKQEDKYIIAANGYMLQWRRYMQIRSIHTGEMLCTWTTRQRECSKIKNNNLSGVLLLMNVEALVSNVSPAVMTQAHIPNFLRLVAVALRDTDRETTVLCVGGLECQDLAARDADWLQCENCRMWWHRACANSIKPVFYCNACQQRIEAVKGHDPS